MRGHPARGGRVQGDGPPGQGGRMARPRRARQDLRLPVAEVAGEPRRAEGATEEDDQVLGQDGAPVLRQPAVLLPGPVRSRRAVADGRPQSERLHVRSGAGVHPHGGGRPEGDEDGGRVPGRKGGRDFLSGRFHGQRLRHQLRQVQVQPRHQGKITLISPT